MKYPMLSACLPFKYRQTTDKETFKFSCGGWNGKKIKVVEGVASALGLKNVKADQVRVETMKEKFDFIVSRAVTAFPSFMTLVRNRIQKGGCNELPNGIIYLKGGDFEEEIKDFRERITVYNIPEFFDEEFFETKKVIYMKYLK